MGSTGKYTQWDRARDSSHNLVISLVPPHARVLEFGCATGYMSEALKMHHGCSVTGIEFSPEAAELARAHCERIIIGNAESLDFDALFGNDRFDVLLFADVLEHLQDPHSVLRRIRPFITEGGALIASIPNIAHGSVRLALLNGEFRYRDTGLLDNTHLRFFTRESIQDLFEETGYIVTHWLRRRKAIDQSEIAIPIRSLPETLYAWLAKDPEVTTYQFVVRAVRADGTEIVHQLRTELATATAELETMRMERVHLTIEEVAALIPLSETFILVDDGQWGTGEIVAGRRRIPFLERHGQYWGSPPDDLTAIREFKRLRQTGPCFIVFAWPAFWWLDCYKEFHSYLRSNFRCVLENNRLVVFDLHDEKAGELPDLKSIVTPSDS